MAFDAAKVATFMRTTEAKVPLLSAWVAAVQAFADERYVTPTDPEYTAGQIEQYELALTMQCARLARRTQSVGGAEGGGGDRATVVVHRFDRQTLDLLSDFLITDSEGKAGYLR